jgi:hypothetical protein
MKQDHAAYDALLAELRTSLDGDHAACAIVDLAEKGITEPCEQADRLNLPIDDVYNVRRRLRYATERLLGKRRRAP